MNLNPQTLLRSCEVDQALAGDPAMAGLIVRVIGRLEAGERVIPEEYLESHPDCVSLLRRLMPVLEAMTELGRTAGMATPSRTS